MIVDVVDKLCLVPSWTVDSDIVDFVEFIVDLWSLMITCGGRRVGYT